MQHLEDGTIQELIDGEVPSHDLPPIQAHLATCDACRARLDTARLAAAEADELLTILDEVAPAAPETAPIVLPIKRPHWSRNLAWAASLMLAVGLGYAGRDVINPVVPTTSDLQQATGDGRPATFSEEQATGDSLPSQPAADAAAGVPNATTGTAPSRQRAATPAPAPVAAAPAESRVQQLVPRDQPVTPAAPPIVAGGVASQEAAGQSALGAAEREALAGRRDERRELAPRNALNRTAPTANRSAQLDLADAAKSMVAAREVDLPTAMRLLGGSIKLIDGMVPHRLDAAGDEVIVVYRVIWGELLLSQRREGDRVEWHLTAPAGFPADSLAVLRGKVRP